MAKTSAERQREYRDRKRGGPAAGRWAGHTTAAEIVQQYGGSRTGLSMAQLVKRYRPDLFERVQSGDLKLAVAYKLANRERDLETLREMGEQP